MNIPILVGLGVLAIFWVGSAAVTKRFEPWALALTDNPADPSKLSASKFQALLWTAITIFSYTTVFATRFVTVDSNIALPALPSIPFNLILLMGLSVLTSAGVKGVTISYKNQGLIGEHGGGLTTTPFNNADLTKIQMLAWNVLSAGIYLTTLYRFLQADSLLTPTFALPDVDGALLGLLGVSQGAYLGNKLVTRNVEIQPEIENLLPLQATPGETVTILGDHFGDSPQDSFVVCGDDMICTIEDGIQDWSDNKIRFKVPENLPSGKKAEITIYRNGEKSKGQLMLDVS